MAAPPFHPLLPPYAKRAQVEIWKLKPKRPFSEFASERISEGEELVSDEDVEAE
jgi:hypothetical protein